jgi:hypothetical protein
MEKNKEEGFLTIKGQLNLWFAAQKEGEKGGK